jgi:hypothetical protein
MPLALFAELDTGSPKQWYVHPDHLDRPSKMTDASQTVVWDAYYTTYGEVQSITGSAILNLRFPGQYYLVGCTTTGTVTTISQLHLNNTTSGDYNTQIGAELPTFIDGPSVYAYARSQPSMIDTYGRRSAPASSTT